MKATFLPILFFLTIGMAASAATPISLGPWALTLDPEAEWQNDTLYLPSETIDYKQLPYNPPTQGWQSLESENSIPVSIPCTLEEIFTSSAQPQPMDQTGVSWWSARFCAPKIKKGERVILHIGAVRQRAEIFVDSTLVGYDLIGETPFDLDITDAIQSDRSQLLSLRITHPGGNYHWQDYDPMLWGKYELVPGRAFGGILAPISLEIVPSIYIEDLYIQNQPDIISVRVIANIRNVSSRPSKKNITLSISPKSQNFLSPQYSATEPRALDSSLNPVLVENIKATLHPGNNQIEIPISLPDAQIWDLYHPNLYTAILSVGDHQASKNFGFRWLEADGIGEDAVIRLNGRRIFLTTAISWGYWPETGLYPTPEMAVKQVESAKALGLNMLSFHRNIGNELVLNAADSLGLLYYEEPGGFHACASDFSREMANEKLARMIKRDRSHPSLVIYNLINEWGGRNARNSELTAKRLEDMRQAHALDPSRIITFTSGWASTEEAEEPAKAHILPFDSTLCMRGWWDNHRAAGPATWEDGYYRSPSDNLMHSDNLTEIVMRGEEGALSSPPRIAMYGKDAKGWDGPFWREQFDIFEQYFNDNGLAESFGDLDSFTRALADVALDHQGRRIQGMRMQDVGDIFAINGWEAMPYDNHSGIVDIYRNCKGNAEVLTRYTQPCYVAVCPRSQFHAINSESKMHNPQLSLVDFYLVSDGSLSGPGMLKYSVISPLGCIIYSDSISVDLKGGYTLGQLLLSSAKIPIGRVEGLYTLTAELKTKEATLTGSDQILALIDPGNLLSAVPPSGGWGADIITQSAYASPELIPQSAYASPFSVTYYRDNDIGEKAFTDTDPLIDHFYNDGAQPHPNLPANQLFSAIWQGKIIAPITGTYMIGLMTDNGTRMSVNGVRLFDEWRRHGDITITRPVSFRAGQEIDIQVEYSQNQPSGYVQLVWTLPDQKAMDIDSIMTRVKEGRRLVILDHADTWMEEICRYTGATLHGNYTVGKNWVGGVHFATRNPLLDPLPQAQGLGWAYQALVRDGERRAGFEIDGAEMIVGSYRSWPFHLGTAMGRIPYGKGEIIFSTLDILSNLDLDEPAAIVARRLLQNLIGVPQPPKGGAAMSTLLNETTPLGGRGAGEGSCILMCPGGGYHHLAITHEGYEWAEFMAEQGVAYAVLDYRLPVDSIPYPMIDAIEAMTYLRTHAKELGIKKIGIMGCSAGGNLASYIATHSKPGDAAYPDFQILLYPVVSLDHEIGHGGTRVNLLGDNPTDEQIQYYSNQHHVTDYTPPALILLSEDDKDVDPRNSHVYADSLRAHGIEVELYTFPTGGHGWGFKSSFPHRDELLSIISRYLKNL
ncbi:MAG: PA14 domain-containing protein [Bacteroidales bacterium]|nr:PA14 domain-containing protein [Bacteroidales bacterium]